MCVVFVACTRRLPPMRVLLDFYFFLLPFFGSKFKGKMFSFCWWHSSITKCANGSAAFMATQSKDVDDGDGGGGDGA